MKSTLLILLFSTIVSSLDAQTAARRINFHSIGRDSVNLPLNEDYYLIEDSCAQIIRQSRFDFSKRKFHGKFTDVSKANPGLIVGEGVYSEDGLKNGLFILHYLNGNLMAKGVFKDDKFDGPWEIYYSDGRPELTFEATDGTSGIIDAWDTKGKKTVDNGVGTYMYKLSGVFWKGKLLNGTPDGTWKLFNADDATETAMVTEHFKKGQFRDGSTGSFDYTNASHIDLSTPLILPFVNAEKMYISPVACNGTGFRHIVNAQYSDGLDAFSRYISEAVNPYFSRLNINGVNLTIEIDGQISEKGDLIDLKNKGNGGEDMSGQIILKLARLPPLVPATVDGKPVKQQFVIYFKIRDGFYQFTYKFLPVRP